MPAQEGTTTRRRRSVLHRAREAPHARIKTRIGGETCAYASGPTLILHDSAQYTSTQGSLLGRSDCMMGRSLAELHVGNQGNNGCNTKELISLGTKQQNPTNCDAEPMPNTVSARRLDVKRRRKQHTNRERSPHHQEKPESSGCPLRDRRPYNKSGPLAAMRLHEYGNTSLRPRQRDLIPDDSPQEGSSRPAWLSVGMGPRQKGSNSPGILPHVPDKYRFPFSSIASGVGSMWRPTCSAWWSCPAGLRTDEARQGILSA